MLFLLFLQISSSLGGFRDLAFDIYPETFCNPSKNKPLDGAKDTICALTDVDVTTGSCAVDYIQGQWIGNVGEIEETCAGAQYCDATCYKQRDESNQWTVSQGTFDGENIVLGQNVEFCMLSTVGLYKSTNASCTIDLGEDGIWLGTSTKPALCGYTCIQRGSVNALPEATLHMGEFSHTVDAGELLPHSSSWDICALVRVDYDGIITSTCEIFISSPVNGAMWRVRASAGVKCKYVCVQYGEDDPVASTVAPTTSMTTTTTGTTTGTATTATTTTSAVMTAAPTTTTLSPSSSQTTTHASPQGSHSKDRLTTHGTKHMSSTSSLPIDPTHEPVAPSPSSSVWLYILVPVLLIVAVAVIAYLVRKRQLQKAQQFYLPLMDAEDF